jgi:hypothetical protein
VAVRFRHPGNQQLISLQYRMIQSEQGWRVADIEYDAGYSLRQILSSYDGVSPDTAVSHMGYGAVRIGQLRSEAERALGHSLPIAMVSDDCGHASLPGADGIGLMIFADSIARIEVYERGVSTFAGDQVGDTEREVLARHGTAARVEPHPYVSPEGHYLVVPFPSDTMYQLIFETYRDTVTSYRVGRLPPVSWIEGCF